MLWLFGHLQVRPLVLLYLEVGPSWLLVLVDPPSPVVIREYTTSAVQLKLVLHQVRARRPCSLGTQFVVLSQLVQTRETREHRPWSLRWRRHRRH